MIVEKDTLPESGYRGITVTYYISNAQDCDVPLPYPYSYTQDDNHHGM